MNAQFRQGICNHGMDVSNTEGACENVRIVCTMQASMLQVLERDRTQIRRLLKPEAGAMAASVTMLDNCQMMETVHENHASHLMPRVQEIRSSYEHLYQRCLDGKVCQPCPPLFHFALPVRRWLVCCQKLTFHS